ncbi:MAG: DUF1641 domain-containing protein [Candidatus Methanodesulfokora sp.]|jgi:uncharacterized protein YjgD (DUF1641 family)
MSDVETLDDVIRVLSNKENLSALKNIVDNLSTIEYTIEKLKELRDMGALDTLFSLGCGIASMKNMLSDEMVAGGASMLSDVLDLLAKVKSPPVARFLSLFSDHGFELEKAIKEEPRKGVIGILSALRDPDVQEGITYLIVLLKFLGKYLRKEDSSTEDSTE